MQLLKLIPVFIFFLAITGCQVKETDGSGDIVTGHVPTIGKFTLTTPTNTIYTPGSAIPFNLSFPKIISVTGNPRLILTIGSTTRYADYVSGTGSKNITFEYVVQTGENDTDGITISAALDLNGGTIIYDTNQNANLSITVPPLSTVLVDSTPPSILTVTPPNNGTYISGANLNFGLKFSEKITVTGTPRIPLTIGGFTRYASYISGSGTDTINFRYTVVPTDIDNDGITMSPIDLNGGSISDAVAYSANLSYLAPNTSSVIIAGNTPSITSITLPASGKYSTGQTLSFVVNFDQSVFVTLTPRLAINLQSGTVYANYQSGGGTSSLTFQYTVTAGEFDTNGIELASPVQPNGGAIQNITLTANAILTFMPPSASSITIDGIDPMIASITPPANGWYIAGNQLNFVVNFTTNVVITGSPTLPLTIGASNVSAIYVSGSGTNALTFRYTVANGNLDTDGIQTASPLVLSGGTIKDIFGDNVPLTFTSPNTSGILVDAVLPTLSSVSGPTPATYFNGQNVDFIASFSESVTVSGTPSIPLLIGSTAKSATYISGSGTSSLTFRYTVATGDLDSDGISSASPVSLNGGSISDSAGNVVPSLSFTPPSTTGVLVDGTVASIISITAPVNGTYKTSNNLDFIVNFSRSVTVTGSPQIQLDVGGNSIYATYLSGSGTSVLTFRYTILTGHKDLNGIGVFSPVSLNGGSIIDSSSNNAILTFSPPNTTSILIDGIDLSISLITPPIDKTYILGEQLDFSVAFNENTIVTGSPRIVLNVGGSTVYANYLSGSGSNALLFRYTVATGNLDGDGIDTVGPSIDLNSGTIQDEFGDNATISFTGTNYPNKRVDGIAPSISSVTAPTPGTYIEGQNIDFTIVTSDTVNVSGTPELALTLGSSTKYAIYISGSGTSSLVFRYTVVAGDVDSNGLVVSSPLELNSGTIKDISGNDLAPLTFTVPDTSGVLVDGVAPIILSVTPPSSGTYKTTNNLDFVVNFSQNVDVIGTPSISLTIGGSSVNATYLAGSGSPSLTFRYIVAAGVSDADGIATASVIALNGGSIKNSALSNSSLTFTSPNTTGVLVDGLDIVISSITPPADATYKIGDNLDFTVNYNYAATVTGTPRIQLTVGAATIYANYVSGSTTSSHLYRYTVAVSDVDTDGITTVGPSIGLNGGTIKDSFGDNATITFSGSNYPNKKVDGIRPTISSMAASANKTYILAENINFTATYSEVVNVTGTPRLVLTVGAATRYANYVSGSGTNTIVFRYTVPVGDLDSNGIAVGAVVELNGGTISDAAGNAQTTLSFSAPTLTGVQVDGIVPAISSITPPTSQTYGLTAQLNFTMNFSEAVTITGTPTLSLNIGGSSVSASYVSGSGTTAIVFRYTTVLNDEDTDGVASVSPLSLAGGTIRDSAGNNATLTFSGITHTGVLVDALPPSVSSVNLPADNTYQNAGTRPTLSFTVNFTENVIVAGGTPRIHLLIGSTTRYATYASGSGTSSLVFNYSVATTDLDLDGIAVTNSSNLDLNGATIRDAMANSAILSMGTLVTNKIFAVLPSMRNWYDLSDSGNTIVGGDITTLKDKIGTYNFTGAVPYFATGFNGGSNAYAACTTTAGDYFSGGSNHTTPTAMIAVFRAPSASGAQYLLYHANATRPMAQFSSTASSGTVSYGVTGAKYTTAWSGNASTQTALWVTNGYYLRGFSWSATQNRTPTLCKMNGQLAEVFFFSTRPTATEMDAVESYVNARYGLSFP